VSWGHILTASLQLLSFRLKQKGDKDFWVLAVQIGILASYFIPQLYSQFIIRQTVQAMMSEHGKGDWWTPTSEWFLLEEQLMLAQVYSGFFFVLFSTLFKLKSWWNHSKKVAVVISSEGQRRVGDVWVESRHTDDFLHHYKFEFMQYAFFGSQLYISLILVPFFFGLLQNRHIMMGMDNFSFNVADHQE